MTRKRLNAPGAISKPPRAPLRAVHAVRPTSLADLDSAKVTQVCSFCRELGILPPRPVSVTDAQLVEVLLMPSPMRFQLFCQMFESFCPELKTEFEELKPLPKKSLEETKYLHILEFVHDAGIFNEGDEADLAKIKGEISDTDHLDFWLFNLQTAKMMQGFDENDEPKLTTESLAKDLADFTEQLRILNQLRVPDASSMVSGPLAVLLEEQKRKEEYSSFSFRELKRMEAKIDSEMKAINTQFRIEKAEEEEEDSLLALEEPPESVVDDEALTKIKLLQGNVKDLVNTFAVKYDQSLKKTVEGSGGPMESRGELEDLLEKASANGESLQEFVRNVDFILDRLRSLRESQSNSASPAISDLVEENKEALALNTELVLPEAQRRPADNGAAEGAAKSNGAAEDDGAAEGGAQVNGGVVLRNGAVYQGVFGDFFKD